MEPAIVPDNNTVIADNDKLLVEVDHTSENQQEETEQQVAPQVVPLTPATMDEDDSVVQLYEEEQEEKTVFVPRVSLVTHAVVGVPKKVKNGLCSTVVHYPLSYYEKDGVDSGKRVMHRFSDFVWLRSRLVKLYPSVLIPKLNLECIVDEDKPLIDIRREGLESFMNRLFECDVLRNSEIIHKFLHSDASGLQKVKNEFNSVKTNAAYYRGVADQYLYLLPATSSDYTYETVSAFLKESRAHLSSVQSQLKTYIGTFESAWDGAQQVTLHLDLLRDLESTHCPSVTRADTVMMRQQWSQLSNTDNSDFFVAFAKYVAQELSDIDAMREVLLSTKKACSVLDAGQGKNKTSTSSSILSSVFYSVTYPEFLTRNINMFNAVIRALAGVKAETARKEVLMWEKVMNEFN